MLDLVTAEDIAETIATGLRQETRGKKILQERNMGKTAAIARAIAAATGDIVIVQDADLKYDPAEIPAVIAPILEGRADVVYGSRFMVRRASCISPITSPTDSSRSCLTC